MESQLILIAHLSLLAFTFANIFSEESTQFCGKLEGNYEICMDNPIPKIGNLLLSGVEPSEIEELNPLKIKSVIIYKKFSEDINFEGRLENNDVYGLQDLNFERFRFDPDTLEGYVHLSLPALYVKGTYSMALKFANTNSVYDGSSFGNATGIDVQFYFQLKKVLRSDVEYYSIKNLKGKIFVKKAVVVSKTDNPAQQPTADFFVNYFNQNYRRLINKPDSMFQKYAVMFARSMAEEMLSNIPVDQLVTE